MPISTEDKLVAELQKTFSKLVAYEGIVYQDHIGGSVFADCRDENQVLSRHIIRARVVADCINKVFGR